MPCPRLETTLPVSGSCQRPLDENDTTFEIKRDFSNPWEDEGWSGDTDRLKIAAKERGLATNQHHQTGSSRKLVEMIPLVELLR